ncbi:MAG: NAD(P)/FAD-dependent oxidoreductase [Bacteroidales bacterium]|nr:NAD(P)/FAD-dependent oxidoreductase [Bacteroidales bacterium]MDT8374259.1 NAD(P)/FAD-dependent oxidoreductase [Bacteroidales bacterium]
MNEIAVTNNGLPRVVIIGAGFAGLNLVKTLEGKPVQIILLDQNNHHQFQPLLYQVAISGLESDSVVYPIRKLFKSCINMIFRMVSVESVDTLNNRVITNLGYVSYDFLVIATGSSTNFYGLKNIENNSIGLKNINDAINLRSWILQSLESAIDGSSDEEKQKLTKFVVVGGGPAGVELAGALAEFKKYLLRNDYPEIDSTLMKIYLIQSDKRILPAMSERSSAHAHEILKDLGVEVLLNTRVKDYDGQSLIVEGKNGREEILAGIVIWTAGVRGNAPDGLDTVLLSAGNRIIVNEYNQVQGLENVYAIGDIAFMQTPEYPKGHPMVAQVAIQQSRNLGRNILAVLNGEKSLTAFRYRDKGSMAIIGKKDAVADIKNVFLDGRAGWLIWSVIHLITLSGFKNKLAVALNWAIKYFTYEKANQLIIRKYSPGHTLN